MFYPIVIFANISANNISQKAEYILAVATCFITTNYKTYLLIWLINRQPPGTQFQSDTTSLVQFLLVLSVPLLLGHFSASPPAAAAATEGSTSAAALAGLPPGLADGGSVLPSRAATKNQRRSWRQEGLLTLRRSQFNACEENEINILGYYSTLLPHEVYHGLQFISKIW